MASKLQYQPDYHQPLNFVLTPHEISETLFGDSDSFYTSFERPQEAEHATEALEVENRGNSCKLLVTEVEQDDEAFTDLVIELKLGNVFLVATYSVEMGPAWRASLAHQRKAAEEDFVKAAALIGCKVERKLVETKF